MNYKIPLSHSTFYIVLTVSIFLRSLCAEERTNYSLFNPVPEEKMRDFVTDRPDKTEAPITVDAGHLQYEMDLLNTSRNRAAGERTSSTLLFAPNLKLGVTNSSDIQLVIESLLYDRETGGETRSSSMGLGDVTIRYKQNLWGNDEGPTAAAVMPYLKIPTNRNGLGNEFWEGGIIAPFGWDFAPGWGLGAMTQGDVLRQESESKFYPQWVNSVTLGRDISEEIGAYIELWSATSSESTHEATLDFGITYMIDSNTQLDIGLNRGVTDAADDYNPFVGISQRF
jgi:Putative MetA-pathway of phenol degradation